MPPESGSWFFRLWRTPLGPLLLTFTSLGLAGLDFSEGGSHFPAPLAPTVVNLDLPPPRVVSFMTGALRLLGDYFSGSPAAFSSLPLELRGTAFQLRVWQELREIPWGETISYKELARRVGKPRGTQAVGQALSANPIALIIPCHRVIKADGSLGGYRGGLERKRWLLGHEGVGGGGGGGGGPPPPPPPPSPIIPPLTAGRSGRG
jgi:O-6-methylguanine DNA methyltransferase